MTSSGSSRLETNVLDTRFARGIGSSCCCKMPKTTAETYAEITRRCVRERLTLLMTFRLAATAFDVRMLNSEPVGAPLTPKDRSLDDK